MEITEHERVLLVNSLIQTISELYGKITRIRYEEVSTV